MAHLVGERFGCDECGAEIVFVKACQCAESEGKTHRDICCGKEMRSLGMASTTEATQPEAGH